LRSGSKKAKGRAGFQPARVSKADGKIVFGARAEALAGQARCLPYFA
jgi:hypothetical protein